MHCVTIEMGWGILADEIFAESGFIPGLWPAPTHDAGTHALVAAINDLAAGNYTRTGNNYTSPLPFT